MGARGYSSQPSKGDDTNRYAFVIHPLDVGYIHEHPSFGWTRYLPARLLEWIAAWVPPIYLSRITGGQSPTTGKKVEGYLYTLGMTPRQIMLHSPKFTYFRLNWAARKAKRRGAQIMGLGAFTSVIGDAGETVTRNSDLAITTGNSLTVYTTIEAARSAFARMGLGDLSRGKAMIIGATGSIGSACARLLAPEARELILAAREASKLADLKLSIQHEIQSCTLTTTVKPDDYLADCDLIITATTSLGRHVLDIGRCKPGAVICDVAQPPDISPLEAAQRPDVLVIKGGEVVIPGGINWGYEIGLASGTAYACLAETILLAMEGRYEDFTIGRKITANQVAEIAQLFKKHQFKLADLHTHDRLLTEEDINYKRQLAMAAQ